MNCNSPADGAGVKRLLTWYILTLNSKVRHQNVQQQCEDADDRGPKTLKRRKVSKHTHMTAKNRKHANDENN